eukprot:TRINITY_DN11972_c0_g1_i8.p1 TRINITY_DN11972_c0_g1~~TRINITY_DN11972_c0_g1_i8.p1  ORF type:complete len:453 (-),score=69.26 TRINITY_DN11972_c0_g1_i8:927-2285(-)
MAIRRTRLIVISAIFVAARFLLLGPSFATGYQRPAPRSVPLTRLSGVSGFYVGDVVEVRCVDDNQWVEAVVKNENADGSVSVVYDNGRYEFHTRVDSCRQSQETLAQAGSCLASPRIARMPSQADVSVFSVLPAGHVASSAEVEGGIVRREVTRFLSLHETEQEALQSLLSWKVSVGSGYVFAVLDNFFPNGPDSRSSTRLLSGLSKQGRLRVIQLALTWHEINNYELNHYHYNTAIHAYAKSSKWTEALQLFDAMANTQVQACTLIYGTAINACGMGGKWDKALRLFNLMSQTRTESDTITLNGVITACEKGGQWQEAMQLFMAAAQNKVESDTITFNAAISACEKGCKWEEAVQLLSIMGQSKVQANTIIFNAAISACKNDSKWEQTLQLLSTMALEMVESDTVSFSTAILACRISNEFEKALLLFSKMSKRKMEANSIAFGDVTKRLQN